jgi:hypothetical protein
MLWGEFRRKSEKKFRMRFHFLGFLKNEGSFFGGGRHIKKVSQNDGNGPMRTPETRVSEVQLKGVVSNTT